VAFAVALAIAAFSPGLGRRPFSVSAAQDQSAPAASPPKLVVLMVADQMRADYVDRFKDDWTAGLKRLVDGGAWFSNAAFPYLTTVTCPGHATISTGAFPYRHGILNNTWFDRESRRVIRCTEDSRAKPIPYDGPVGPSADSAVRLRLPAFSDEMKKQRGARVASVSLKARSAIMLGGHSADAVTWLSESLDVWETSTAFGGPVPAVSAFLKANPVDADFGKRWERLLPVERYQHADVLVGEASPRGWSIEFPHVLSGMSGKPDADYHTQWERSPYADAFLGRFAAALVESLKLGQGDTTDVLAVSFSTPDLIGHAFGPRSQEVQDIYAHLDIAIGALFDRLDTLVGRDRWVAAFSSDHGVSEIPEQLKADRKDGGRLNARGLADFIERRAQASAGPGRYLMALSGSDVHFEPSMYLKLASTPGALEAVMRDIAAQDGIARVFRRADLARGTRSGNQLVRAASLSYMEGQSGDLVVALKPGWMFAGAGTTHGSANPDDQRVPIMLLGPGIKPGQYRESATPADIVPTLASLVGITMPSAEGRVLSSAMVSPPAPSTRP
jgi:predicted AlkP superfamily pyrophosphatase or phosphodiesterase